MLRYGFSQFRVYSTRPVHSNEEVAVAKKWLRDFQSEHIPRDPFSITYSRSSGPGGQKVNKTLSKATVSLEAFQWLNPRICSWIPVPIIRQIAATKFRYLTKMGGLHIQSDTSRSREVNTDECFRKLLKEIKLVVYFEEDASEEDKKKWQKLAALLKEYRLQDKKRKSDKKKARSKKFDI
ncbi:hypothetical protein METBIDRAFT_29555 [Metschnikowia bicuspidata var. bicuspidata NRRL YB-4993]|uniref:Prokaryotic-type class I peptide chain release factors domain-containing protein n=1 Tax=Metschnikowia bicuspidata var. bicuspidata NRRL YB-4993 TaxID=869754 RepID=A0A1A0HG93_9ASCO|nr:hypothetical protein METBIDRAFT_29555 [Metschnikowia bicuspidata var. bicuspidata NRRL YB-4993]OBA23010.1 hypothetical protein METBIDRAFT_29555 [Metschnikowia bicuspidata var. bicuspidata NRRL YB-4993]